MIIGITTIRALKKDKMFDDKHCELQDTQRSLNIIEGGNQNYMRLRLDFISVVFVAVAYLYCIIYRNSYSETSASDSSSGKIWMFCIAIYILLVQVCTFGDENLHNWK